MKEKNERCKLNVSNEKIKWKKKIYLHLVHLLMAVAVQS